MAKMVRVPKVPQKAFDPGRPPSALVQSHVRQLQEAVFAAIDSEGEAAVTIRTLTKLLQQLRPQTVPESHARTLRRSRTKSRKPRSGKSRSGK